MIGFLKGSVDQISGDLVYIDVNGVGYEVYCSQNTQSDVIGKAKVKIFTYTHVREEAFLLFGFSTLLEKEIFLSLIGVNGIGPKMAIGMLSASSPKRLAESIDRGDVSALVKLPKVGKKKAEQIILSLKGKLVMEPETGGADQGIASRATIVSALVNLGFKLSDVEFVVEKLDPELPVEEGIRKGLSALATGI